MATDDTAIANGAAMPDSVENKLFLKLTAAGSSADERKAAAADIVAAVNKDGASKVLKVSGLLDQLKAAATDAKAPAAREGAFVAYAALAGGAPRLAEPYLVPMLPTILDKCSDKITPVRVAAEAAGKALMQNISEYAIMEVLPTLLDGMELKKLWQTKVAATNFITELGAKHTEQMKLCLPLIVPVLSGAVADSKLQVKEASINALRATCKTVGNKDVDPFIPVLIDSIAKPSEVAECVHKLSATTFVQAVEAPTLAMLVPLLVRGMAERQTAIKRKTAVITDNMAKLVDDPVDAAVFLPRLLPGLKKMADEISDPEARGVAERAHKTLLRVGAEGEATAPKPASTTEVLATLKECIAAHSKAVVSAEDVPMLEYVSAQAARLIDVKIFTPSEWSMKVVVPFLAAIMSEAEAEAVCKTFVDRCYREIREKPKEELEDNEGEDLCNAEFSLAYGGKILLNNARLWLKRGRRYGLCGPNGCGKSTLMRAIANGQLEGFPPKEELRTVYVEHDIDASQAETPVVEFVYSDPNLQDATHPAHAMVEETLASVGFSPEMQAAPVASLSGGWKMKLALARAMLMRADIMLLDEPTNHLDVTNVAWLEKYLTGLDDVTSMIVSHDSGFLDNVCTDIIHYEDRKLKRYRGNLSEFVKVKPEARTYYDLEASGIKFVLPEPGFLEGIKSKDRAILKLNKVGFKYPGMEKNVISSVTGQFSLNSRVAVIGPNGAGKSTMIKILTGEIEALEGIVWKHPNLRVAYVAQHAFHHIEQHLDSTPNQYIQWRYGIGEDREQLQKVNLKVSEEEEKKMAEKQVVDGEKRVVEKLLSRRKLKRSYEYEVQWVGLHSDKNSWLSRDKLVELGFEKMVNAIDIKEAAAQGLYQRPLTTAVIEKHLADLGIEPEFGTHSRIRGLSGGQKVKVVIAAAMWNNPHMLVLDEPTNYLDRESLGALAGAIKDYGGGVIMITHNSEFSSALCPETWKVANGVVEITGQSEAVKNAQALEMKREEEMTDAFGNTVKIKQPKKTLSNKEKKKKERLKAARRKAGETVSDSEEEDW